MNDGLLPLLGCIVDSFREKTPCSYGDDDCTAIERGTDDLIPVNLQDTSIVCNPGFLLVCHGDVLWLCRFYTSVDIHWLEQPGEAARKGPPLGVLRHHPRCRTFNTVADAVTAIMAAGVGEACRELRDRLLERAA
jgi:hypothetical protein